MSNSTLCDPTYPFLWENLKYLAQAVYLVPTAILYSRLLYVMRVKHRSFYRNHQFFTIYSMDCVVGLLLVLMDIITRVFLYVPQMCLPASEFFISNGFLLGIYYPLVNYLHCSQPFIQITLTTNRMSSVLFPVHHNTFWERKLPLVFTCIALAPLLFIWNTIISKKYLSPFFGGFYFNYTKAVPWAGMSFFLLIIRSFAVAITVITTSVTFWNMSKMKHRLKKSERVMCVACAMNSLCFLVPAVFEALRAFGNAWINSWVIYVIAFSWDVLNVGSPIVMICASNQLRAHVFSRSTKRSLNRTSSIAMSI